MRSQIGYSHLDPRAYIAKLHGYKRNNYDIKEQVYRGGLSCGAGSEELVMSCEGKIRPCHFLPENIFSVPSENALYEHIHGYFHVEHLQRAIVEYIDVRKNDDYELCRGICEMR